MDKNEQRICWYSSLLIALMVNSPKLLALRENGLMSQYWRFDPYELFFQFAFNLLFCGLLFSMNLRREAGLSAYREKERYLPYAVFNILIFFGLLLTGALLRRLLFPGLQSTRVVFSGPFFRLGLSSLLTGIIIKIVLLMRNSSRMAAENQQLKNAYLASELQLLKEQVNPHFLFNSLSSLSAVVRENPEQAQKYIRDLSAVFRYALVVSQTGLVPLSDELAMLKSFAKLISMRLEDAFELTIDVPQICLPVKLPHLSLQPLLENAVKHNAATRERPLRVTIRVEDNQLIFTNSLWEIPTPEASNGMGLVNLNERFRIIINDQIQVSRSDESFIVKLPLRK